MLSTVAPWAALVLILFGLLWLDLHFFARGREPGFREAVGWSIGWLLLSLAAAAVLVAIDGRESGVLFTTVYLIERSLSLDNLFVFLVLFAYFAVPSRDRGRLLFAGIVGALVLRGIFIVGGVAVLEQLHFLLYVMGAGLLILAVRLLRGVEEGPDPERNLLVRAVRRVYPVTPDSGSGRFLVDIDGRRHATPLFLCLAAIVFADLIFAIDSIPAAFAVTRDPLVIWMGNVFALLGLRALFVLVEGLVARFRYLDETIAVLLALVGLKLLLEPVVKIQHVESLVIVAGVFTIGVLASIVADRRDPNADQVRAERKARMHA
ncbi:MAG TPA: TerC/Alx family metal homeostasis membrane protein [Thermoleophilaceae bacterium]|jgi:tellurite resistance protein TerC